MMTEKQIWAKYGEPGPSNLIKVDLPYSMRLAWDPHIITKQILCHKLISGQLQLALEDIYNQYGIDQIRNLGIDKYGGCYNYRLMRGSTKTWSHHSWGIAIDLDPERNQLKQDHTTAQFAKPEYKPMIDIFYKHGFKGLGPEEDRDWMHFEIAA